MTDTTLKPCPFCGGEAIPDSDGPDDCSHFIRCRSCAAEGGWAKLPGNAVRLWNTRTQPEPPADPALLEAAQGVLSMLQQARNGDKRRTWHLLFDYLSGWHGTIMRLEAAVLKERKP